MSDFNEWFETFLEEKNLPYLEWEIMDTNGEINFIDSDCVIDAIISCSINEKKAIKDTIVKIDFSNGDVNDFFKHLAKGLVYNRCS